ncbi:WecB/TagA/CpsF family glycosyltransferase [Bacillus nitratireducens]|uniref:WecB/TagA/CpsF family glycosyltransferase n=1 Tax=Bacillus nitratireducens TaxID=2026193 RepID=UPI003D3026A9
MNTVKLFNCDVACLNLNETLEQIERIINTRSYTQHVVINAGKVVLMQDNEKLREIVHGCNFTNADGQSIVWAAKLLGRPLPERVTGIDIMEELVKKSAEKGYRIFFFGAKEEVVTKTVKHYQVLYPDIQVAGYRNGYFKEDEEQEVVAQIKNSKADILFVAFSSPAKEYFLNKYGTDLNTPFCMGVGGSFDVVAGVTERAPLWMQKSGLEWFYRFIQEPKRMWKRYLVGNSRFLLLLLKEWKNKDK